MEKTPTRGIIHPDRRPRRPARLKFDADGMAGPCYRKPQSHTGQGPAETEHHLSYLDVLSRRLRHARIYCKALDSHSRRDDWRRLCCESTFTRGRRVAVFLDPPYGDIARSEYIYGPDDNHENSAQLGRMLRSWCRNGSTPQLPHCSVRFPGRTPGTGRTGLDGPRLDRTARPEKQ